MTLTSRRRMLKTLFAPLLLPVLLAGCAAPPASVSPGDVDALADAIAGLGPEVSPVEARLAAEIAYTYPLQLAAAYGVTDAPLIHNEKVHAGTRPRGLCNHWTEDMLKRLAQEDFKTLTLHWATSPPTGLRIIHHSAAISARGAPLDAAIILDPWRSSGALTWAPVREDTRFNWRTLREVTDMLAPDAATRAARD